ncbi:hypothetical protein HHI36_018286 [Cryptolaemus montrouzieri]|uniref:Reverse transcriptase domain-containing protein n=1 Tax=Cryptolaemus montrouzieri TaxID=559131 RepID=A0ABD2NZP5_9CUCU
MFILAVNELIPILDNTFTIKDPYSETKEYSQDIKSFLRSINFMYSEVTNDRSFRCKLIKLSKILMAPFELEIPDDDFDSICSQASQDNTDDYVYDCSENSDGFYARLPRIQQLINDTKTGILCLQETNLTESHNLHLKEYEGFHYIRTDCTPASGGVSIFSSESIFSEAVPLTTNLAAVAISIWNPQKLTICNIYHPPNKSHSSETSSLVDPLRLLQRSLFGTTLFILAINDISDKIRHLVKYALYADDLIIFCHGRNAKTTTKIFQKTMNDLNLWR